MGGEYYFKVRGEKARAIVVNTLNRAYGTEGSNVEDGQVKEWYFPEFFYGEKGAVQGLQLIEEARKGTFELSYSIWGGDTTSAYIFAVCAEIRKQLLANGLDFASFGNNAIGKYEPSEWIPIMELGYYEHRIEKAKTESAENTYYKGSVAWDEQYCPNYLKKHKFLVYLLQKRLEDFK